MASKLRNMQLTSVDMCRKGANQEADICLFKSEDGQPPANSPDTPSDVEKGFSTFDTLNANRESQEKLWQYTSALTESIRSIQEDRELSADKKLQMMKQSLGEFDAAMVILFQDLSRASVSGSLDMVKSDPEDRFDYIEVVEKANPWHGPDGRFTSGPGGAAGGVASRTITGGGISYHVKSGKEPKSGYMCAVYTERSKWLKGEDVTDPERRTAAVKSYMEQNKDVLSDPDNYLGTWYDTETGSISLDISRNFSDRDEAIKYASEHNEKAIWDVANMAEISTGGTGNNIGDDWDAPDANGGVVVPF